MFDARDGAIVEVEVRDFESIGGKGSGIDRKAMVLARDFDFLRQASRMIETPVPKLQLKGLCA